MSDHEMRPEIYLPPPPARLTRFYGNVAYGRDVFRTKEISFIHVSLMNDPFDPYFEFVNDFGDSYRDLMRWVANTHGASQAQWLKKIVPYEAWKNIVDDFRKKGDYLKSSTFLFCASSPKESAEPFQNLYMWGHYGAGHSGIAIEYDVNIVASSVLKHQVGLNPKQPKEQRLWTPIFYQDKIERLTAADFYNFFRAPVEQELETKIATHFNTISRTKSTVWQPEQEWRLMWRNDVTDSKVYRVPLLAGAVRRVFVGLKMDRELAKDIAAECKAAFPEAEVLKGAARPGEFALDFQSIA